MSSDDRPIDLVPACLEGVEDHGNHCKALCPAYDDNDPNLYLKEANENSKRQRVARTAPLSGTTKIVLKKTRAPPFSISKALYASEHMASPTRRGE